MGYVEARLQIPGIQAINKDSLFMVSNNSPYMDCVPIHLGTLHIREAMKSATQDELAKLSIAWKMASFPSYLDKNITLKEPEFDLNKIKGHVRLTKPITIAPFQTVHVLGLTGYDQHSKRVNVIVEPDPDREYESMAPIHGYTVLKPGSSRVSIGLQNYSCCKVMIPAKSIIAKVSAANVVPQSLAPNLDNETTLKQFEQCQKQSQTQENVSQPIDPKVPELTPEKEKLLFNKIDLTGAQGWDPALIEEAQQLFHEFAHIFALESIDMGHTSMVKHKIRLDNYTPFKERYHRIPPHLFDEAKNHMKEMIEVGAIHKSNSPWASAIVLVRKKDGSLRFCIDLHKLNARTIKDAYSLPCIDETLDCLGGATIFTSLDLRSGYWQVEMEEESKPLTAFTVGPLGFYECERMPFGLTNAPVTFQCLMENCLGELHLSWCIIYLDDIIVFSDIPSEHLRRLRDVFAKLDKAGLKLKPNKSEFFKTRITYLGHIVSSKGKETDPKKVEAVKNWTIPKTVTDVRSFLGFTNYYRRFIRGYAKVNTLVSGNNANFKKAPIEWTDECQVTFDKLKDYALVPTYLLMPITRSPSSYRLMLVILVWVQFYTSEMITIIKGLLLLLVVA